MFHYLYAAVGNGGKRGTEMNTAGDFHFAVVSKFNGEVQVHIRQYELNATTQKLFPTKMEVCLPPQRFAVLCNEMETLKEQVALLRDGQPVNCKKHLGDDVYCTIVTGYDCVNLRRYWVVDGSIEPV